MQVNLIPLDELVETFGSAEEIAKFYPYSQYTIRNWIKSEKAYYAMAINGEKVILEVK